MSYDHSSAGLVRSKVGDEAAVLPTTEASVPSGTVVQWFRDAAERELQLFI